MADAEDQQSAPPVAKAWFTPENMSYCPPPSISPATAARPQLGARLRRRPVPSEPVDSQRARASKSNRSPT